MAACQVCAVSRRLLSLLLIVSAVAVLLAPAVWNGFPFVWADTGGYLARPFERTLEIGRSALYGTFLAAGISFDFWLTIAVQAALTAWMLTLSLRAHGFGSRPWYTAALIFILTLLTSLPWYVGTLMPDIFVPLAVLGLYLLAFRRDALRRMELLGLTALVAFAIASHMATLGLSVAVLAAFAAVRPLAAALCLPRPALAAPAVAIAAGIALAFLSNFAIAGRLALTPGGVHFVFGRLVQDRIVARYLADRCPDATLRLCPYRDQLPNSSDGWLWGWDSPFYKLGGADGFAPETRRIIADTLRMYPGQHGATAARAALQQFVMVRTGEGIHPRDIEHAARALERFGPDVMPRYRAARQQHDAYDFAWINRIHVPLALAAVTILPFLIAAGVLGRIAPSSAAFALTVLLALIANAAICGALSNPNDRYQSRLVWLAPLAVAIAVLARRPSTLPS